MYGMRNRRASNPRLRSNSIPVSHRNASAGTVIPRPAMPARLGQVHWDHGEATWRDERNEARDKGEAELDGAHEARVSRIKRARVWSSGNGWTYFVFITPRGVMKKDSGCPVVP